MAQPTDRASLVQYCLRRLGKGAIDINVTDEQADDRIDDAIDYMTLFHFDGIEKKYLSLQVAPGDIANGYFQLANNVTGVTRIFSLDGNSSGTNSLNGDFNIFDLNYQLRLNELYDFTSADYVYFELANEHIRTLEMLFIGDIPIRYNRYNNKLYIDMAWEQRVAPGVYVVAEVYVLTDESAPLFWGDMMMKQLSTAFIKRQWGENLKKFQGTPLPGGLVLNGQQIYDEAVKEIEDLKVTIRETFEAPVQFEVG